VALTMCLMHLVSMLELDVPGRVKSSHRGWKNQDTRPPSAYVDPFVGVPFEPQLPLPSDMPPVEPWHIHPSWRGYY